MLRLAREAQVKGDTLKARFVKAGVPIRSGVESKRIAIARQLVEWVGENEPLPAAILKIVG